MITESSFYRLLSIFSRIKGVAKEGGGKEEEMRDILLSHEG